MPVECSSLRAALTNSGWIGISERTVPSSVDGENWREVDTVTVADFGFVGVAAQRVVTSSDGLSWVEHSVDMDFHDVAAIGSTVVAPARDGIYVWTGRPASLPNTGTTTTPAIIFGAGLLGIGAAILAMRRRSADAARRSGA